MPNAPLSDRVKEFVRQRIHSVEQLEALMLLLQLPIRSWCEAELVQALQVRSDFARRALEGLIQNGLCRASGEDGARVFEWTGLDEGVASELTQAYQDHRLSLIVFISRSAIARVRKDARQTFFGGSSKRPPKS